MSDEKDQLSRLQKFLISQWSDGKPIARNLRSDPEEIVKFFAGMPEDERRKLAPEMMELRRQVDKMDIDVDIDRSRLWLGIYATATLAEMSKLRWWSAGTHACAILADRNVPWLQDWAEKALEECDSSYTIGDLFEGLLDLVERGLIDPPQHDNYAIGAAHLATWRLAQFHEQ